MSEHRIEIICKDVTGDLRTLTLAVTGDFDAEFTADIARALRKLLEPVVGKKCGLASFEHIRDYPVKSENE